MAIKTINKKKSGTVKRKSGIIPDLVQKQRDFFLTGDTKDISFRIDALKKLKIAVKDHYKDILKALDKDLRKHEFEAYITEIAFFFEEINFAIKHVKKWTKNRRVKTPWLYQPATSRIMPEPYGVTLIIGPWNYPFQLVFAPLVAAIAAGNTAILKPSELSPATSKVISAIIKKTFPESYIGVVEGGIKESQVLLNEQFDYIFFTGGTAVGKIIMEAAAKHLTPVTLELGGKSPVIVDKNSNIRAAAKKIVWGKFINAGQTCIAPDYLLVHREIKGELIGAIKEFIAKSYGNDPRESPYYPRIISKGHLQRLDGLLKGGDITAGGRVNSKELYLEPTIIENVEPGDAVMKEEIFGPILPVLEYGEVDEAIELIRFNPNPLALYLFSDDKKVQNKILHEIAAGGVVINDSLMQVANQFLPFGGVGASGIGSYHGKYGFETFSHMKPVFKRRFHLDILFRYPPYKIGVNLLRKIFG